MSADVAFIPVRGGSTSIPLKNIKPLAGKPLVYWTAAAAAAAPSVSAVYVSTDSDEIWHVVEGLAIPKVRLIGRSAETATNTASSESALLEFAGSHEFDRVVFIQATSPLLETGDIERGLDLARRPGCDSVVSVVEDRHFYWSAGEDGSICPLNYDVSMRPRRQDFKGCYQENGALYITSRDALLVSRNRASGTVRPLVMPEETMFEIDEPADWEIVESLLRRRLCKARVRAGRGRCIKLFLTDCDGCLTDGGMYYGAGGEQLKKFNTRDGMAFALLREAGIKCGIVTGESSPAVGARAKKLGLEFCELGCSDKLSYVRSLAEREGVEMEEVAYMGDDLNDVELLAAVGMGFAPADASRPARDAARHVTEAAGGQGAVREAAEMVLYG